MDTWVSEDSIHKTVESLESCVSAFYKGKSETGDVFMQGFDGVLVDFLPNMSPEGIYCVTLIAQKMRERIWKLHIEGITMPPQQEQTKLHVWKKIPESLWKNTILIQIKKTDEDKYTCRGPYNPYFGSHTGQRARKAPLQVIEVGSLISSIRMLLELLSWVNGDNIQKLILICVEEKTSISMQELQKYLRQVYSGTITHRLSCPTLQGGGMANTNLTYSSWVKIISDTATTFAKKAIITTCVSSLYSCRPSKNCLTCTRRFLKKISGEFTCSDCTWKINERFTLDRVDYQGVPLANTVVDLRPRTQPKRVTYLKRTGVGAAAFTIQTSRKVALWVIDIVHSTFGFRPKTGRRCFLNPSELKHLDLQTFLEFYILYNYLYNPGSIHNPRTITDPILQNKGFKSVYDVVLDWDIKQK